MATRNRNGAPPSVVTDEEVSDRLTPSPNAFMWIVDITDEAHPVPISTWAVPHDKPFDPLCWFGAHQPQETVNGNIILVTWFGGGLRAVEGMSGAETAECLGIPEETVKTRLHRARARIQAAVALPSAPAFLPLASWAPCPAAP